LNDSEISRRGGDAHGAVRGDSFASSQKEPRCPRVSADPQALVHDTAYQALNAIRIILARDDLEDPECFRRIEKIVRVFERIGSDCGTRHDFG